MIDIQDHIRNRSALNLFDRAALGSNWSDQVLGLTRGVTKTIDASWASGATYKVRDPGYMIVSGPLDRVRIYLHSEET